MGWWLTNEITEVDGEPSPATEVYVNSEHVAAIVPTSFYDTTNSRTVWYLAVVGADIPADLYLNAGQFLNDGAAQNAAKTWCGGRDQL